MVFKGANVSLIFLTKNRFSIICPDPLLSDYCFVVLENRKGNSGTFH
ncbi:hypothetical protein P872_11415 [Rhodonellum psychrophilum GCM71 = DSM 17998]|uniref:Uncharacterized protein n=2 Tax=Rhodonellum TaxID=336827 RepID=U5BKR7_9BACT|nr:hypothetical protein P872_11415 [Rhodonellum psychrophilum GCM71 = DSM 17998]SDZ57223.1 hypothetical protein SAMN05444412_12815 [Rhodonellum ikkaensis]